MWRYFNIDMPMIARIFPKLQDITLQQLVTSVVAKGQHLGQRPITQGLDVSKFPTAVEVRARTP